MIKTMNVLLVRPPRMKKSITLGELMFCEPLGLEIIYTLIRDICGVTIFDMMVDKRKFKDVLTSTKPDFVGFTTLCIDRDNIIDLSGQVKKINPEIITAVGGTHAFWAPEVFFHPNIDHVIQFTGLTNIRQLLTCMIESKTTPVIEGVLSRHHCYASKGKKKKNIYIHPDISCTRSYRKYYSYLGYRPCAIMQTSLGCSAKCSFCMRWRIEGAKENNLPLGGVIEHINTLPEQHIMIVDNDLLHSRERISLFCRKLESNAISKNFICYASVKSILANEFQMAKIARNGFKTFIVGYETFSEKEMKTYNKNISRASCLKAARVMKQHNIDCWASFILHPDWNKKDFKAFRTYIRDLEPELSTFSPLTPFPGLGLYSKYEKRLLFTKQDYSKWTFGQVTVRPLNMSLKQYYGQMLKTMLYINLMLNSRTYMINRFGLGTFLRIAKGSVKVFYQYIILRSRT